MSREKGIRKRRSRTRSKPFDETGREGEEKEEEEAEMARGHATGHPMTEMLLDDDLEATLLGDDIGINGVS